MYQLFSKGKTDYRLWALFNFFVLALVGLLLRYMHNFSLPAVNYEFLLHSHSHFAFSGWMFLAIAILVLKKYQENNSSKRFNYLFISTLLVSFGMLVSFFLSGYKSISIILSTVFVLITYWFVVEVFILKLFKEDKHKLAKVLLTGSLIFLAISSFGPFALGYFKAAVPNSVTAQQNSLYFYLHFQMNGFMQLALLGLFFSKHVSASQDKKTAILANSLVYSTLPLYFMFTLWANPPTWCYAVGFLGAIIHLVSWTMLIFNYRTVLKSARFFSKTAFVAISVQFFMQVLIFVPQIGQFVFSAHNLIIGYIHLLTLGSLTPLILDFFIADGLLPRLKITNGIFIASVVIYLTLLFGGPFLALFGIYVVNLEMLLFISNSLFPVIAGIYFVAAFRTKHKLIAQVAKVYN